MKLPIESTLDVESLTQEFTTTSVISDDDRSVRVYGLYQDEDGEEQLAEHHFHLGHINYSGKAVQPGQPLDEATNWV